MPFTLAHPAAVVPLRRYLGRFDVLSALVIGSLTPDMHYFFPFQPDRVVTHSLAALWWYCLPVGLALYLIYHLVLKLPLIMLLPASIAGRLAVFFSPTLPKTSWRVVIVSLLIGAITHLGWDAFTHGDSRFGRGWAMLQTVVFRVNDDPTRLYDILQYVSAPLGIGLLAWWSWRWLRCAPLHGLSARVRAIPARTIAALSMIGIPSLLALSSLRSSGGSDAHLSAWHFLYHAMPIAVSGFGPSVIAYGLAWHIYRLYARSTPAHVSKARTRPGRLKRRDAWVRTNETD